MQGPRFNPWSGNKTSHAATKTQCPHQKRSDWPHGPESAKLSSILNPALVLHNNLTAVVGRMCVFQLLSHVQLLGTPWTVAHQAPPSMRFSRHESWTGLPFPPLGHLPDPGIKPKSPASPVLQADSLPAEPPGNPPCSLCVVPKCFCLLILKIIYCTDSECKINVYWTRYLILCTIIM